MTKLLLNTIVVLTLVCSTDLAFAQFSRSPGRSGRTPVTRRRNFNRRRTNSVSNTPLRHRKPSLPSSLNTKFPNGTLRTPDKYINVSTRRQNYRTPIDSSKPISSPTHRRSLISPLKENSVSTTRPRIGNSDIPQIRTRHSYRSVTSETNNLRQPPVGSSLRSTKQIHTNTRKYLGNNISHHKLFSSNIRGNVGKTFLSRGSLPSVNKNLNSFSGTKFSRNVRKSTPAFNDRLTSFSDKGIGEIR